MVNYTYVGGTATCSWGLCQNTSQKNPTLRFIPFPSQFTDSIRAARWAWLCGRKNFTGNDVTYNSYICAEHFDSYENVYLKFKNVEDLNPMKNQTLEPHPHPSVNLSKPPKFVVPTKAKPKIPGVNHQCESCGKSFASADNLKIHIHTIHEGHKDHKSQLSQKALF